jgi:hypothetical protein
MIKKLNDFLNAFERFYKRLFLALIATILYPFIIILFIFGLISANIKNEDED